MYPMNIDYHSIGELPTNESLTAWVLDTQSDPNGYWGGYKKITSV